MVRAGLGLVHLQEGDALAWSAGCGVSWGQNHVVSAVAEDAQDIQAAPARDGWFRLAASYRSRDNG